MEGDFTLQLLGFAALVYGFYGLKALWLRFRNYRRRKKQDWERLRRERAEQERLQREREEKQREREAEAARERERLDALSKIFKVD